MKTIYTVEKSRILKNGRPMSIEEICEYLNYIDSALEEKIEDLEENIIKLIDGQILPEGESRG